MKKCDTCANRNTRWCNGCEHNFPGLEQSDFYQETAACLLYTSDAADD